MRHTQKRQKFRRLAIDFLEDRRVLAAGWNSFDFEGGPENGRIVQPPDGSRLYLITDSGDYIINDAGNRRVPKYRTPNNTPPTIAGSQMSSPNFVNDNGDRVIRDFRWILNEPATGFQLLMTNANEPLQFVRPYNTSGNVVGNTIRCVGANTGTPDSCQPGQKYILDALDTPGYVSQVDFGLVNGVLTGAGGPENFDLFSYFVPAASLFDFGGTTVEEGGNTETLVLQLNASLTRPNIPNASTNWNVRFQLSAPGLSFSPSFVDLNNNNFQTGASVTVSAIDDGVINGTRNTTITASVVDAESDPLFRAFGDLTAPATILDNDSLISVSPPTQLQDETNGMFSFSLTRTGTTTNTQTVPFSISGTAAIGVDYQPIAKPGVTFNGSTGTVEFGVGETTRTVMFQTVSDTLDESNEDLIVSFGDSDPSFDVSPNFVTGIIADDDFTIDVDLDPVGTITEGENDATTVKLTRSEIVDPTTVTFELSGTASEDDYVISSGANVANQITFPDGASTVSFTVTAVDDFQDEPQEELTFTFADGSNFQLAPPSETITIIDNDPPDPDFNDDGLVDCNDVDALVARIVNGPYDPVFDLDEGGSLTTADLALWLERAGAINFDVTGGNAYLVGDANLDGVVDALDFIEWNNNKFTNSPAWCSGDFNADGIVDGNDFILWNINKFQSSVDARLATGERDEYSLVNPMPSARPVDSSSRVAWRQDDVSDRTRRPQSEVEQAFASLLDFI